MSLQQRIIDAIPPRGLSAHALYDQLHDVGREAVDCALSAMLRHRKLERAFGVYTRTGSEPPAEPLSQICDKCGEIRALDEFGRVPRKPDQRLSTCKECRRQMVVVGIKESKTRRVDMEAIARFVGEEVEAPAIVEQPAEKPETTPKERRKNVVVTQEVPAPQAVTTNIDMHQLCEVEFTYVLKVRDRIGNVFRIEMTNKQIEALSQKLVNLVIGEGGLP